MSKRPISTYSDTKTTLKKVKLPLLSQSTERETSSFSKLDENLLYEILKHADARTLAVSSCVSKQWNRTAYDERLWELICTRRWISFNHCGGGEKQLRSVVLALGGFRRLYSLYLSKTVSSSSSSSSSSALPITLPVAARGGRRWGKDEVNLSLSLLSIRYYEKMGFGHNKDKSV